MKKALVVLSIIMLFASMSFATNTRVNTLGVSSWMVQDEYLSSTLFPQMVPVYVNTAKAEASAVNAFGQVNLNLGPGVLGAIANMPGASAIAPNVRSFGLIYGMDMKGMTVGFGLLYGSNGTKTFNGAIQGDVAGDYTSTHSMNFGIVAGSSLTIGKDMPLDLGLKFNLPSNFTADSITKDIAGAKIAEAQTGTTGIEIGLDGRMAFGDMMANLGFSMISSSALTMNKVFTATGTLTTHNEDITSGTTIGLTLGAAKTLKMGSILLILGVDPSFTSLSTSRTNQEKVTNTKILGDGNTGSTTNIAIPMAVGIEGKLNETWILRGGVSKSVWNMSSVVTKTKNIAGQVTANTTVDTTTSAPPTVSIGFGAKVGDVSIDGNVATAFLLNGPWFLTGVATPGFNSMIGISYNWK